MSKAVLTRQKHWKLMLTCWIAQQWCRWQIIWSYIPLFSGWDRSSVWVKWQRGSGSSAGLHEFSFWLKFCHPQAGVSHSQMMKEQQKAEFIAELASGEPGDAAWSRETTTTEMEKWNSVLIWDGWGEHRRWGQSASEWAGNICSHGCLKGGKEFYLHFVMYTYLTCWV